jgi:hypothetical protein
MTVTFLAWVAVGLRVALSGVRSMNVGRRPVRVPVGTSTPRPVAGAEPDEQGWRPRVSSGCGR